MEAVKVIGQVDQNHQLVATVPDSVAPGNVEILVLTSAKETDHSEDWVEGIAREWHDDLEDARQDIYSLTDGVPLDGRR